MFARFKNRDDIIGIDEDAMYSRKFIRETGLKMRILFKIKKSKFVLTAIAPVSVSANHWFKSRRLSASRSRGRLAEDRNREPFRSSRYLLRGQRLPLLRSVFVYPGADRICTLYMGRVHALLSFYRHFDRSHFVSGYHPPTPLRLSTTSTDLFLPIVFKCGSRWTSQPRCPRFGREAWSKRFAKKREKRLIFSTRFGRRMMLEKLVADLIYNFLLHVCVSLIFFNTAM